VTTTRDLEAMLELRRVLPAPADEVFDAWTRPELMVQWFAPASMTTPAASVDLREGGAYRVEMQGPDGGRHVTTGRYLEVVPARRLVFTWGWDGLDRRETIVTVELHARGEETELVLRHERFATAADRDSHRDGWSGALEKLAAFVAGAGPARGAAHP
jgi:uncharacterized protein YndB with AHSA1/START domain